MNKEQIFKSLGFFNDDGDVNDDVRNKYLLTEEEQDKAISEHLAELSKLCPLSKETKRLATYDALCGAQFLKAYNILYEKWCV